MTQEQWKPVKGYERLYEVSNLGRVRSKERIVKHNCGGAKRLKGKMLTPYKTGQGRYQVSLWREGMRNPQQVHRLVMLSFVGECPENMEVRHLNSDPTDNRLCNLAYGTKTENVIDALKLGRHGKQKITPEEVLTIRQRLDDGELIIHIAKEYGVCNRAISNIKNRRTFWWM